MALLIRGVASGIMRAMKIKRDFYLNRLIEAKGDGFVKIVTGIRRCGKSYLLFNLFKTHLLKEGGTSRHQGKNLS